MDSLRQELDCSELQQRNSVLEDKLNVAVSENDRLQRAIGELDKWKEKLERESQKFASIYVAYLFVFSCWLCFV